MEKRSTFLPILQRRMQVEKVSAHSPCAIVQVERYPSPLGRIRSKCMSHGWELMQGRGKLWDLAPCTEEERGDWEQREKRSGLCSYMPPAELCALFRVPAFCLGDPDRNKDACLVHALAQQDQSVGNMLSSVARYRWTVVHAVVIYLWLLGKRSNLSSASGAGATLNCLNPPPVSICLGSLPGISTWQGPVLCLSAVECPMSCFLLAVAK